VAGLGPIFNAVCAELANFNEQQNNHATKAYPTHFVAWIPDLLELNKAATYAM
jgi:hypothetical protein